MFEIEKIKSIKKIERIAIIFTLAQLTLWYGGLADILPDKLINIWNMLQMVSTFILIIYVLAKRKGRLSKFTVMMLIYIAFITLSGYINGRAINYLYISKICCLTFLMDYYSKHYTDILIVFLFIFELMIYYNLYICIKTGPDIMGAFYGALGYDNGFASYFSVAYFIAILYMQVLKRNIRPIILISAIHFTALYTWTGTSIIALFITDILLFIAVLKSFKITFWKSYLIFLMFEFAIVILKIQNTARFFIEDVLHKDLTFTGRTLIWESAIEAIGSKLLYGFGIMSQELEKSIIGAVFCHNGVLELWFQGGIIYFILFSIIVYLISKQLNHLKSTRINTILVIAFSPVWIISISESILSNNLIYIIFLFMYYLYHSIGYFNDGRKHDNDYSTRL